MTGTRTHRSAGASRIAALKRAGSSIIANLQQRGRHGSIASLRCDSDFDDAPELAKEEALDIERIAMRLDGFEMYAFLASLIAGFSFGCLNEFDAMATLQSRFAWWVSFPITLVFACSLIASTFCGLYATCVFALCSLYSKTALAECKDARSMLRWD